MSVMDEIHRFPLSRLEASVRWSLPLGRLVAVSVAQLAGIPLLPSTTRPKSLTTAALSAADPPAAAIASSILLLLICSGAHGPLFCPNPWPRFARRIVVR